MRALLQRIGIMECVIDCAFCKGTGVCALGEKLKQNACGAC
jgi:hypothetical protein